MSSATGVATTAEFRLAYAQRKLRAFIRGIIELQSSEFPHSDSRKALEDLALYFEARLRQVERVIATDDAAIDQTLAQVNVSVYRYTPLLGFILRSTNVRNAFETYFHLKRLVKKILGSSAHLVTSAEWLFIPFTYPMSIDALPDYVLVGAPAPEAANTLIVPLAGHEIGHSAWRKHNVGNQISQNLVSHIDAALDANPARRDNLLQKAFGRHVQRSLIIQTCYSPAIKQLEEIFCDFVATFIFGESYLWAFEYFLVPGSNSRSQEYPSGEARIRFLIHAARQLGISADPVLFQRWRNPGVPSGSEADILSVTDGAVERSTPQLWQITTALLQQVGIAPPSPTVVTRVLRNFEHVVPDSDGASIAEVVTAGWQYLSLRKGLPKPNDDATFDLLNELMLKSIEVTEYRMRVQPDA